MEHDPGDTPSGGAVRTFLIADVRGYTAFTLEQGDEAAAQLATRFADLTREVVAARDGTVLELRGDEALAVFASARQALRAAVELQARLTEEVRRNPGMPIHVGIGVDAGEAVPVEDGFRGAALNLAARLCALAGPGEVLASETVSSLARRLDGIEYQDRGVVQLKGFADPVLVRRVAARPAETSNVADAVSAGAPQEAPPQNLPIGGFLGSLPSGTLVARDGELQRILTAMEAAAAGEGRLVMLVGEPGVGKTRLAQEATLAARNQGFFIAAGSCYEARQSTPFYPFLDVLAALYAGAPPAVRAQVPHLWPHVATLLPNWQLTGPVSGGEQDEHERLFWAVTGFLQAIAERIPVALLLDDLHWADSSTLDLLHHLARHTRADRVLMLATYRDVEVGHHHPLEAALRELDRQDLVQRIPVRRLPPTGTAALVAVSMGEEGISAEFADLIYGRTEGNPFFVQQVLRVLVERGDVFRRDGVWDRKAIEEIEVPESIRSVIGQRLSRLSEATQAMLHDAAVFGQRFGFEALLQVGGHDEEQLEGAIEEARAAGLIREIGRDDYAFDHALTQGVLYADLPSRRRRRLHGRAADVLERLSGGKGTPRAAELAWHLLEADEIGRALPYCLQAGDEAEAMFAHSDAEWHYRTALQLARELEKGEQEAVAAERLGRVLTLLGRTAEAIELLEGAAAACRSAGAVEGERRIIAAIGRAHLAAGSGTAGIARLEPYARATATEDSPSWGLASLNAVLARLYWTVQRFEESVAAAERASGLARALNDLEILAEAETRRGTSLTNLGRSEEGLKVLGAALPIAEAAGNPDHLQVALNNLSLGYANVGDLRMHTAFRKRALEAVEHTGNVDAIVFALAGYAIGLFMQGEWQGAMEPAAQALERARSRMDSWSASYAFIAWGGLHVVRGEWDEGRQALAEAERLVERAEDLQGRTMLEEHMAAMHLAQNRPEVALERIQAVLARLHPDELAASFLVEPLARSYLALGDASEALRVAQAVIDLHAPAGHHLFVARALWVKGAALARLGRWAEGDAALRESLSLFERMPAPYQQGLVLCVWGELLAQRGQPAAARERLEEAVAIFRRLGAAYDQDRAERQLAGLGEIARSS